MEGPAHWHLRHIHQAHGEPKEGDDAEPQLRFRELVKAIDWSQNFMAWRAVSLRDNLRVGFLRILRGDIDQGIGYTVLTWSRDGDHWERSREPFMAGCPGAFDAAHAWVYAAAEHDGTIYLSYSAYDLGHKLGNRAAAIAMIPSKDLSFDRATGPHC